MCNFLKAIPMPTRGLDETYYNCLIIWMNILGKKIGNLGCKERLMSEFFTICKDVRISDSNCWWSRKKSKKWLFYEFKAEVCFLNIRSVKYPGWVLFKIVMLFYRRLNIPAFHSSIMMTNRSPLKSL